jgi:hypothetical protein
MTKFILIGLLLSSTAAYALPQACDPKVSFQQILGSAREVVFKMPVQVRIHDDNRSEKDFLTTTEVQFRFKGYVDIATDPIRDGVEVAYENSWGSSSIPYPHYLDATIPSNKYQLTLKVPYPNPGNPDYTTGITAEFEGNIVRITDYFHYFSDSSTYIIRPSESCITMANTTIIK